MLVLAQSVCDHPRYLLADDLSFGSAPVVVARLVPVITQCRIWAVASLGAAQANVGFRR
jgi:ABC-type branched-subunit amino acid transport system ATPase component